MPKPFRDLTRKKYQRLFNELTLGEVQLLLLGLWVIGDQNRVDLQLLLEFQTLVAQLKIAAEAKAQARPPVPAPNGQEHP